VEWEGDLYGNIETWEMWWETHWEEGEWAFIGVKKFEGLWIKRIQKPVVILLGNAVQVSLTYNQPDIPWPL
jgi:hypothetical protein